MVNEVLRRWTGAFCLGYEPGRHARGVVTMAAVAGRQATTAWLPWSYEATTTLTH